MTQFEVAASGSEIELHLWDEKERVFRLTRHEVAALLLRLTEAIRLLPSDPTKPLRIEGPFLIVSYPSFQLGTTPAGELALMVRPDPLPPMEIRFSDDGARKLIEDLSEGLKMVRQPRPTKPRH